MTLHTPIEHYMSPHPLALRFDQKVRAARRAFLDNGFTSIPIVEANGRLCGIVSATDLLREARDEDLDERPLVQVMSWPVVTEHRRASIAEAASVMSGNHLHHLVVVDDDRRPVGIISASDVVLALAESGLKQRVSSIMSRELITLDAGASVAEARQLVSDAGVTAAAVSGAAEIVGVVDQIALLAAGDDVQVEDVMEAQVLCVSTDTSISQVADELRERGARRALVLDSAGEVAGIATLSDLVNYAAGLAELDGEEEDEDEEEDLGVEVEAETDEV